MIKIELNQEAVDRMVKGLSDQKWRATPNYISPSKCRCAIGWMVSEEDALRMQAHLHYITALVEESGIVEVEDHDDLLKLQELQDEHDLDWERGRHGLTDVDLRTSLRRRILHWCLRHGFDFNDPNVEVLP